MEGKVKWFNDKKGYGFIETESEGDIFVHYSGIEDTGGFRSLQEGENRASIIYLLLGIIIISMLVWQFQQPQNREI